MLLILFRTLLIYVLIVFAMRLMGKKQLGELQPSELVSTILISNLASISIESPELPLMGSIVPVFIIVALEILLSALCVKSRKAATLVSGSPRVIICNGVLDQQMLLDLRFTVDDLLEALREKDIFELSEVDFALVETNGSISVRKKFAHDIPNNHAFQIPPPKAKRPSLPLVIDGTLCRQNLQYCGVTESFVQSECQTRGCSPADIFLLLCNDVKEITLIKKEGR
ncbi:MAG: DUF421 domain-containing protein [Ruthenibacterium sp.]